MDILQNAMQAWHSCKPGVLETNIVTWLCRGFTKYARDDYVKWKKEGRLTHDGVNAKLIHNHGRLAAKVADGTNIFETPAMDKKTPLHGGE